MMQYDPEANKAMETPAPPEKALYDFGFDLGDGESAVAWMRADGAAPPLMLEVAGRKSVLTALGQTDQGDVIGEQACLIDAKHLNVCFKSRFLTHPAESGAVIRRFAARVLEELAQSGKLPDVASCAFFIGCPSGWNAETRARYRTLFLEAGFQNVDVISESRAAFMFVRESGELGLSDQALSRPTLVIDAGSSTTDFTFIHQLRAMEIVDFGENHLGGGFIDRLLLKRSVQRHAQAARIEEIFTAFPQYRARCEIEARKVKEMYFSRRAQVGEGLYHLPCESSVKLYASKPPITLDIACAQGDMDAILGQKTDALGGESYLSAYRRALTTARAQLHPAPETILLTGGASRMDFMRDIAREIFPKAELIAGAEPEFSIARGLCYALGIDRRTARFEGDVKALVDSDAIERLVMDALPALFQSISPIIAHALTDDIAPAAFRRWKLGALKTIDEMSEAMRDAMAMTLAQGDLKAALEPVTRAWLEGLRPALEELTDPICARCHLPLTMLRMPCTEPVDAARLEIDAGRMVNLDVLQTVVDVVVASIVAALLGGGGIAMLMAGPIGLLISFAIGFIASRVGTTLARQHIGGFNMPMFMRALFPERAFRKSLEGGEGELSSGIYAQLKSMLSAPDPSIERITRDATNAIERQLTDMAREARLLIH